MAKLNIPPRNFNVTEITTYSLNFDDVNAINTLPFQIQTVAKSYLSNCNGRVQTTIDKITKEHIETKERFIMDISNMFNLLSSEITNYFQSTTSSSFRYEIRGNYNCFAEPTLDLWEQYNPGKMAAIKIVISELKQKGYDPVLKLPTYKVDLDDGMTNYDGSIILECSI